MTVTISFKVSEDEARFIRSLARDEEISVSEYLRRRASAPAPGARGPRRVRCCHTGALIYAAPDDQPPLTTERVGALLADFP